MKVYPTKHFSKVFKRLPSHIQRQAVKKDKTFRRNMFASQLRTHPLKGKLSRFYAYRINREYRVIFEIIDEATVIYHDIGTHSVYR